MKPGTTGIFHGPSMLFWCNEQISSVDRLIANLDRCGVEKAVLSVSNWLEWLDPAICRWGNDPMHEIRRRLPHRPPTLPPAPIGAEGAPARLARWPPLRLPG